MKLLATATPNKRYRWYGSLADVHLEARLVNTRLHFYEVSPYRQRQIGESLVKALFPEQIRIRERPFLKDNNPEFFAILHRHRKKYRPTYLKLIEPKHKRTK